MRREEESQNQQNQETGQPRVASSSSSTPRSRSPRSVLFLLPEEDHSSRLATAILEQSQNEEKNVDAVTEQVQQLRISSSTPSPEQSLQPVEAQGDASPEEVEMLQLVPATLLEIVRRGGTEQEMLEQMKNLGSLPGEQNSVEAASMLERVESLLAGVSSLPETAEELRQLIAILKVAQEKLNDSLEQLRSLNVELMTFPEAQNNEETATVYRLIVLFIADREQASNALPNVIAFLEKKLEEKLNEERSHSPQ